jgi:nicotinate-nucleotide adenylyltransferase
MRIGLLGGSFNPAHEGHRHASLVALKRLRLDQVWWLVSPQNPLKPERGTAPFDGRLARAQEVARHPRLVVTDLERRLGTRYTIDTIRAIKRRYPQARFVWIMGSDNFAELQRWKDWQAIMAEMPLAVIARPGYGFAPLATRAAKRYAARRLPEHKAGLLLKRKPPVWAYLHAPLNPLSSTALRAALAAPVKADGGPAAVAKERKRRPKASLAKAPGQAGAGAVGAKGSRASPRTKSP